MRFAFYGRVGTDTVNNPEDSILGQRAECERMLALSFPDSRIVAEFADVGYGGRDYRRPALKKLLSTAMDPGRQFDHIVVSAIDRLSRTLRLLDTVETVLEPTGVTIYVALDGER